MGVRNQVSHPITLIYGQQTAPAPTAINTVHHKGQKFAPGATVTSSEHVCGHRFASHMQSAYKGSMNLIPRRVRSSAATTSGSSSGITNDSSMQEEHTLEQRAATYLAQRCGSKGHGEDQGWEKGTLTQDKDRGQGASLSLLDHLQGSVLSTLRFALRFSTPARISTIYASLYQTSGSPPQSGPASLPDKSVYLDMQNSIQQMQNGLLTSYLRAIFSRGMREDPVARAWRDRGHGCGVRSSS